MRIQNQAPWRQKAAQSNPKIKREKNILNPKIIDTKK